MWNHVSANHLITQKQFQESYYKHINNLMNAKPKISTKAPYDPEFLKTKPKKAKIKEDRSVAIGIENKALLDRMMSIAQKPSSLNPDVLGQKYKPQKNWKAKTKLNDMKKIDQENEGLLKRLQTVKSTYGKTNWQRDMRRNEGLKMSISKLTSFDVDLVRAATANGKRHPPLVDFLEAAKMNQQELDEYDPCYLSMRPQTAHHMYY